jgi:drug/metabolite transporter (DMT)-like permease
MEQNATMGPRVRFLGYGACALAGCLWGTGFYWGRLALDEMSVEHMVLYRFLFACVGMLPVVLMNLGRFRLTGSSCACCCFRPPSAFPCSFCFSSMAWRGPR